MKKRSQALISLFAVIVLLAGCQGQTPVSQSTNAAASSAVFPPSTAVSESVPTASSTPQPMQKWGTAGIGDTVTVAGVELTLETFTVEENEIVIEISRPELEEDDLKRFAKWRDNLDEIPYHLFVEEEDGVKQEVSLASMMNILRSTPNGFTLTYETSTLEGGELPANPTFHLTFTDETGIIPGFTFS